MGRMQPVIVSVCCDADVTQLAGGAIICTVCLEECETRRVLLSDGVLDESRPT